MTCDLSRHLTGTEAFLDLLLRMNVVAKLANRMRELADVLADYTELSRAVHEVTKRPLPERTHLAVAAWCRCRPVEVVRMGFGDLVQQPLERAPAQHDHGEWRSIVETSLDLSQAVSDDRLEVNWHIDTRQVDVHIFREKRSLLPCEPLNWLQARPQLLDDLLGKSPVHRRALGVAPLNATEVISQAPVLEHVDGQPCELRIRKCGPEAPQDLGLRPVSNAVWVDVDAVTNEVSERCVRVVEDVSAPHAQQVLELLLQQVVDGGHGQTLAPLRRGSACTTPCRALAKVPGVGSWWSVVVGKQEVPVWGKSYVPDALMLLFTDNDHFVDRMKVDALEQFELQRDASDPRRVPMSASWHSRLLVYSATAGTLRTRLELQGFSSEWVRELSSAFFEDKDDVGTHGDVWSEGRRSYPNGAAITAALTTRRGQAAGAGVGPDMSSHPEDHFLYEQWMSLREAFDDPRFALSLSLSRTRALTVVTLDLTDLVLGGWLTTDEMPHRDARSRMSAAVAASGPVIVIAEGASDARWLRRSLEIAAPEIAHHFEFLDFAGYSAPGGTDRVVSLAKGMAAAGVMNRIVAVLDNDTAGRREAARQLKELDLPSRLAVVTLPAVPFADQYPTLGPEGSADANVNGRAASIEFMFGDHILRDTDDSLFPVRWHSFVEKAGEYQGRLDNKHKNEVGERIDRALSGTNGTPDQVRDGCRRLTSLLLAAADPPRHIPASEGSVLSAMWRRDPFCKLQIES